MQFFYHFIKGWCFSAKRIIAPRKKGGDKRRGEIITRNICFGKVITWKALQLYKGIIHGLQHSSTGFGFLAQLLRLSWHVILIRWEWHAGVGTFRIGRGKENFLWINLRKAF